MSAPPYMKLFWGDYHKSTRHLTRDQHGAYFLLIGEAWRLGGSLPDDDHLLASWSICTPAEWVQIKPVIMDFFVLRRGKWVHDRVQKELATYEAISRKRKEAGKKGGSVSNEKDKENSQAIAGHLPTQSEPKPKSELKKEEPPNPQPGDWDLIEDEQQSAVQPEPDKPERKSRRQPKLETYPEAFEELWKAYPHVKGRSSKPKALAEWEKRPEDLRAKLPGAASRFAKEGREPNMDCGAKALERWLRDRNYDDWLDAAPSGAKPSERRYRFPNEEIRDAVIMEMGEDWVSRRLDYCDWQEVPTRAILAHNTFIRDEILRERDVFKRLRIDSVKLSPRAVA